MQWAPAAMLLLIFYCIVLDCGPLLAHLLLLLLLVTGGGFGISFRESCVKSFFPVVQANARSWRRLVGENKEEGSRE